MSETSRSRLINQGFEVQYLKRSRDGLKGAFVKLKKKTTAEINA